MARIENNQGHYLELVPVAYQFETSEVEDIDDLNWLEIRLTANDGNYEWSATDPALQTWEVASLIKWLRQLVIRDRAIKPSWYATEPCLECEGYFDSNVITFIAALGYEFWPPALRADKNYSKRTKIVFEGDGSGVLKFASELEKELQDFPIRRP